MSNADSTQGGVPERPERPRTAGSRVWLVYLALGVALAAAYPQLPRFAQGLLYGGLGLASVAAILAGVRMYRPARPRAWLLFAAGLLAFLAGDAVRAITAGFGEAPFLSVAGALYLPGYALIGGGLLVLVRGRIASGDRARLVDSAIIATGLGMLWWGFVLAPRLRAPGASPLPELLVPGGYLIADILLFALVARFAFAPGGRVLAYRLLGLALASLLVSQTLFAADGLGSAPLAEACWLIFYVLWGAAALHPTMDYPLDPGPQRERELTRRRLALLAVVSVLAPALLATQTGRGEQYVGPALVAGSVVLFSLILVRTDLFVRNLEKTLNERREAEKELHGRNELLSALNETTLSLMDRLDPSGLLENIVARAGALAGTPHGYVYLVDPDEDGLSLRVSTGVFEGYAGHRLGPGEGLSGRVWQSGRTLIVDEYDSWPGRQTKFGEGTFRGAAVGVPLKSGSRVAGVLGLAHLEGGREFEAGEVEALERFAELASIALDDSRLYESVRQELAERERTEEELRRSEERLRTVVGNVPVVLFALDRDGVYTLSEGKGLEPLGREPGEFVGRSFFELYRDEPRILENVRRALAGEEVRAAVEVGGMAYEAAYAPLWDERGEVTGVIGVAADVTGRKRAEEKLREAEERYRTLVERMPAVVYIQEIGGPDVTLYMSPQIEDLTGYSVQECQDPDLRYRLVHPDDREWIMAEDEQPGEPGQLFATEYRVVHRDGRTVWVRNEAVMFEDEAGGPRYWQGFMLDITKRKRAEEELRESEQRFRQLFEQSADALLVHDDRGRIVDCNPEACRTLGYSRGEMLALSVKDFSTNLLSEEEKASKKGDTLWGRAISTEQPGRVVGVHHGEHRRKDGTTFPVEVRLGGVDYGGERLILASVHDVTERKALEEQLRYQATHDSLTGLPNRTLFLDRLCYALDRAKRRLNPVAVLFVDLDDFKVVNDSLGHDAGDSLLVAASRRLRSCTRPGDTVARLGGDEFTVLFEDFLGVEEATGVAQRVADVLKEPFLLEGQEVFVTASIGIGLATPDHDAPEDLLRDADLAMYQAKENGKARHQVFDLRMKARAAGRLRLEGDLRRAVERGEEFVLYYQPVVSATTSRVLGFEALVRWRHPERGMLPPSEFIPLAEETGLIVPIGRWVLEEACRRAKEWQHPSAPPVGVGVNVSLRQFQHTQLVRDVASALRESGLEPRCLSLEITETVAVRDVEATVAMLRKLKGLGVRLAIDDFGTGHSSLTYLIRRFGMEFLKLDSSFTVELEQDPDNAVMLSGIVKTAQAMGLQVIAEGVETAEQLALLQSVGCDAIQGFYFSRPISGDAASNLLKSNAS